MQIERYVDDDAVRHLVHAFVTSRLDYCNSLYANCNKSTRQRLRRVQNCAARLVMDAPCRTPSLPLFRQLHWLPIEGRVLYLAYKLWVLMTCLHCIPPPAAFLKALFSVPYSLSCTPLLLVPFPWTTTSMQMTLNSFFLFILPTLPPALLSFRILFSRSLPGWLPTF